MPTQKVKPQLMGRKKTSSGIGDGSAVLARVVEIAQTLPVWLRFIVVFAVLLVVVVMSGKAVQPGLVPLLYVLLLMGSVGYLYVEIWPNRLPPTELGEKAWLDLIINRLRDCHTACIYVRYFRDPEVTDDQRMRDKQAQVRALMTEFSRMLLNNESGFLLVGFRKKAWTDDPKGWLVKEMIKIRPDMPEIDAKRNVDTHIRLINQEPGPNSSTVYLINDRYLFFNRVSGEIGRETKRYHTHDYNNSVIPLLIKHGLSTVAPGQ